MFVRNTYKYVEFDLLQPFTCLLGLCRLVDQLDTVDAEIHMKKVLEFSLSWRHLEHHEVPMSSDSIVNSSSRFTVCTVCITSTTAIIRASTEANVNIVGSLKV